MRWLTPCNRFSPAYRFSLADGSLLQTEGSQLILWELIPGPASRSGFPRSDLGDSITRGGSGVSSLQTEPEQ
jgi:hypothetical protein